MGGAHINIFNRKEIYITMDIQKFSSIVNLLERENIVYTCKTCNTSGIKSGTIQAIGLNHRSMFQYYIYVHKEDYKKALYVIHKSGY